MHDELHVVHTVPSERFSTEDDLKISLPVLPKLWIDYCIALHCIQSVISTSSSLLTLLIQCLFGAAGHTIRKYLTSTCQNVPLHNAYGSCIICH